MVHAQGRMLYAQKWDRGEGGSSQILTARNTSVNKTALTLLVLLPSGALSVFLQCAIARFRPELSVVKQEKEYSSISDPDKLASYLAVLLAFGHCSINCSYNS